MNIERYVHGNAFGSVSLDIYMKVVKYISNKPEGIKILYCTS